jgi:hypothetical protein
MSEDIDIVGEIRRHLQRDPFEPFVVVMASGDRYAIEEAEGAPVGRSTLVIFTRREAGHKVLRLSQVSSVEFSGA